MPSKSKTKGSGYERDMAKFLSETYDGSFVRVPNSGAFIGGKNQVRTVMLSEGQIRSFKGDIIPPDDWKYFNCECKFYAEFPFHQLFTHGTIGLLEEWVEQTMEVADDDDLNVIFMKFNRRGQYVLYQDDIGLKSPRSIVYTSVNHGQWRFVGAEDFWAFNDQFVEQYSKNGVPRL